MDATLTKSYSNIHFLKTISSSSPFLLRFPSVAVLFSDWLSSSDDYGVVSVPIFVEHFYLFSLECCSSVHQSYCSSLRVSFRFGLRTPLWRSSASYPVTIGSSCSLPLTGFLFITGSGSSSSPSSSSSQ